jgi:hypothetical protein
MRPLDHPIPNTCFMSCVKIIGQDLGFDLDIMAFIDRFSELCHKDDPEKRFAFYVTEKNLEIVSGVMGFRANFVPLGGSLKSEYKGDFRILLDFHAFNGDTNHAHCMVYLDSFCNGRKLRVICPSKNGFDEISLDDLKPWKCNLIEIRAA